MDARQQLLLRPLAALSKLLLDRRNMLQGPSYGATEASARWHPEVTTWLRNESDLTSEQIRELGQKCVPIYIVNCPSLHPVPGAMLRNRNTRLQVHTIPVNNQSSCLTITRSPQTRLIF